MVICDGFSGVKLGVTDYGDAVGWKITELEFDVFATSICFGDVQPVHQGTSAVVFRRFNGDNSDFDFRSGA